MSVSPRFYAASIMKISSPIKLISLLHFMSILMGAKIKPLKQNLTLVCFTLNFFYQFQCFWLYVMVLSLVDCPMNWGGSMTFSYYVVLTCRSFHFVALLLSVNYIYNRHWRRLPITLKHLSSKITQNSNENNNTCQFLWPVRWQSKSVVDEHDHASYN